jgi:hypothetical protein
MPYLLRGAQEIGRVVQRLEPPVEYTPLLVKRLVGVADGREEFGSVHVQMACGYCEQR